MKKSILALSVFSVVLLLGAGCSNVSDNITVPSNSSDNIKSDTSTSMVGVASNLVLVGEDGVAIMNNDPFYKEIGKHVGDKATQGDIMSLPYMYESEKMAEDLFFAWDETYDLPVFASLSESHAVQRENLAAVMGSLQVDLSVAALEDESFKDATVQALFDKLLPIGDEMRVKAYTSGLLLEESIIKNINTYLERGIDGLSKTTFEALREASSKNMKVLSDLLIADGGTYKAQVITQSEFDSFVK
ncbi:MAG: hypothetical protein A2493_02130 [Candidatus Magasanikbacteria bacterium RIFOXYC12_FULL_33_11]|uniref:DUF2202 domain-containing protein n=1 Tax=Candidatus Magasanikbacteria bacterium RIFOXYC12_FULL_33_11 TaxID=1798701 RepID=A0A1F6NSL6_9BACT|nr:MAG: hypothetical protein A2493_02130 [Candidatus Magasanikbacteria bacterium RIFOXYC12_FULL_33_11]